MAKSAEGSECSNSKGTSCFMWSLVLKDNPLWHTWSSLYGLWYKLHHTLSADGTVVVQNQGDLDDPFRTCTLPCRLDTQQEDFNPFNWSIEPENVHHSHLSSIPHTHQSVLSLIGQWLETFPEDFRNAIQLRDYVGDLLQRLKRLRGVYTPHSHQLRSLLHDLQVKKLSFQHAHTHRELALSGLVNGVWDAKALLCYLELVCLCSTAPT